jgi:hypothetical protein
MSNKENKLKKALVYGLNYLARPLGNLAKDGLNIGHPYAAIGFGLADIVAENSGDVEKNIINRFIKLGGAAYFSFLTVKDLIEFAGGNYEKLKDFPFDLSMAASLGSDLKELYNQSGGKTFFSDIKDTGKGIVNLF